MDTYTQSVTLAQAGPIQNECLNRWFDPSPTPARRVAYHRATESDRPDAMFP